MNHSSGDTEMHAGDEPAGAAAPAADGSRAKRRWLLAAPAIFALALVTPFHEVWRDDISVVVPMFPRFEGELPKSRFFWKWIGESEQRFVAWQVSRNARVLRESPSALFDTEQCHPTKDMMALGEPMIALGVLGIPFQLLSGDPLVTYNWVLLSVVFLSAFSMFLLVKEWTGVPAAGIVAGLLFAFHSDKIADINHYYIHDNLWTVLALLLARRFFARGYWRDALGLAACCGMQIAGSYYPFVGAILIAPPLLFWLYSRYGSAHLAPAPLAVAMILIAAIGYGVFGPYLEMRSSDVLIARTELHFAVPSEFAPGGGRFPGWIGLGFAALALCRLRRETATTRPQAALFAACILVVLMTVSFSGAKSAPPLYHLLAGVVPGLDAVRRPNEILSAFHLCFTLLAGFGCASLLRRVPRSRQVPVAVALIFLTYVATLRPGTLGLDSPVVYRALKVRPAAEQLDFFELLEQKGNTGPIFETPRDAFHIEAKRVLLSGYHRRRTSSCVNELNPNAARIQQLTNDLPSRAAILAIAELGFTTIISHHPSDDPATHQAAERLRMAARRDPGLLLPIHASPSMTAYAIRR